MIEYIAGLSYGIIIGFIVAIPIGPVGLICIQKTILQTRLSGIITGLGAAIADSFLASISAFSITVILTFINREQIILRVLGSLFLLILGVFSLLNRKKENIKSIKKETAVSVIDEFISGFFLTITNPLTTFFFFITFVALGNRLGNGLHIAITFVIGIFIGSCLWWLFLTFIADKIAHRVSEEHIKKMNKWFAIIITIIGIVMFIDALI